MDKKFKRVLSRLRNNDPTLTELVTVDLPDKISDEEAKAFAEALENNHTVKVLELLNKKISKIGIRDLIQALKNNSTLAKLVLSNCGVGDDSAQALAEILQSNRSLMSLYLDGNEISNVGAQALADMLKKNQFLRGLGLGDNEIDSNGARSLIEILKINRSLAELDLSKSQADDECATALAEILKTNHSLTRLDLSDNQITQVGANVLIKALETNYALILWLKGNKIENALEKSIINLGERNEILYLKLYKAINENKIKTAKNLILQGVSLLFAKWGENTPLHSAVVNGNVELTAWLIEQMNERKIPLTSRNTAGKTAAELAASNPKLAKLFSPIASQVSDEDKSEEEELIQEKKGTDSGSEIAEPSDQPSPESPRFIIDSDDEIPNEYLCPITKQIMRDAVCLSDGNSYERTAIERWLKENKISPVTRGLLESSRFYPNRFLQSLINNFVKIHPQESPAALIDFIKKGNKEKNFEIEQIEQIEQIERLLWLGAKMNAVDDEGNSVLHWTVHYNEEAAMINCLLKYGADVNLQNKAGQSPLHWACIMERDAIVSYLLDTKKANVSLSDKQGKTPLRYARDKDNRAIIKKLEMELIKSPKTIQVMALNPQLKWMSNLDLTYGDIQNDARAIVIEAKNHKELRDRVQFAQNTYQSIFNKEKGKENTNYVAMQLGFLCTDIQDKQHYFCKIDIDNKQKFIHVSTEYASEEELYKDLQRYHPEEERQNEIKAHFESPGKFTFFLNFHHSERGIFKHLESVNNLRHYVSELANEIKKKYGKLPENWRVKIAVIDMDSSHYLCNWCRPALFYFQQQGSVFYQRLREELLRVGFEVSEKFYITSRYTAEQKASGQSVMGEKDHTPQHEVIDIKAHKKARTPLILQRDDKQVIGAYQHLTVAPSKNPKNLKATNTPHKEEEHEEKSFSK